MRTTGGTKVKKAVRMEESLVMMIEKKAQRENRTFSNMVNTMLINCMSTGNEVNNNRISAT